MAELEPVANYELGRRRLAENAYPGRIAIMGLAADGATALQAYAIMGRSAGSRNRIFVQDGTSIRTTAPDKTPEEMAATPMAELIYYRALASEHGIHVVSNGAQTDPVLKRMQWGSSLDDAVRSAPTVSGVNLSRYEPDTPNFTPRITGVIDTNPGAQTPFGLSIVRKEPGTANPIYSAHAAPLEKLVPGVGFGIQTYLGDAPEGEALPSYDQKPFAFPLGEGTIDTAHAIWDVLNADNRVSVVVRAIDLESGHAAGTTIVNSMA